jgi:hypothetical protein
MAKLQDIVQRSFGCDVRLRAIDKATGALLLQCTGPAANRRLALEVMRKANVGGKQCVKVLLADDMN